MLAVVALPGVSHESTVGLSPRGSAPYDRSMTQRGWAAAGLVFVLGCGKETPAGDGGTTAAGEDTTAASDDGSTGGSSSTSSSGGPGESSSGPGDDTADSDSSGGETQAALTIYLVFDGIELMDGPQDATMNTTSVGGGVFEPYQGDASVQGQIGARLVEHWAPFSVDIVDQRPESGAYTMLVVTPTNAVRGASNIGNLDCDDANTHDVAFAYSHDDPDPDELAKRISQAVGFGLGIAVSDSTGISGSTMIPANAEWEDMCVPVLNPPAPCAALAMAHCTEPDEHNPYQIILDRLGPASG